MLRILTVAFLLISAGSLPLFSQQASIDTAAVKSEILSVIRRQEADWNGGSIERFMNGYARSDSLRFASGGSVSYGWKTMLTRYLKGYPDASAMGTLTFSGIDVMPVSESAALAFGKWELTRIEDHPWGYFTLLFRRFPEGWRIVHDHTSSAAIK